VRATITKIDQPKIGTYQASFIRVYFQGQEGGWYQTDVVPTYRNYKVWKPILESGVGTILDGLEVKHGFVQSKIDADSPAVIVGKKLQVKQEPLL